LAEKRYLMTPGPTPAPPEVLAAIAQPVIHHRGPDFRRLYSEALGRLREVFRTEQEVLLFGGSGSGAMESGAANLLSPGDPVLVVSAGYFGERWAAIAKAYGAEVDHLRYAWGEIPSADDVAARLREREAAILFFTHSETSTGVVIDPQPFAAAARETGALSAVDAVSSLGAVPLETDAWGIDVVASGAQKALMTPPGLAFASVSERALAAAEGKGGGRYYFDWAKTAKSQAKGASPFTPAVSLFLGLDVALQLIEDEGIENVWARHDLLARATRAGALALGLDLYGEPDERSTVVTAIELPGDIDGGKVPGTLRKLGITANGGQDHLKGRILRIAHCGYFGAFDILTSLSGLEIALQQLGHDVDHGTGVGAAQRVFLEAGVLAAA
jgi:serine---pyruvate transaminase